jgi:hypothetical protein
MKGMGKNSFERGKYFKSTLKGFPRVRASEEEQL